MRAWYDISHPDFNSYQDESGIHCSQKALDALIEREIQRGIDSKHIFLAGFSSIPEEVYESALIDGANRWQTFIKISIPFVLNFHDLFY